MVPGFVKVCLCALFLKNVLSDNYFLGSSYLLNYGGYNLSNTTNYTAKLVYPDNRNGLIISDVVKILSTETSITLDPIPLYGTTQSFSIPQGTNGTVGLYSPNSTTPSIVQNVTIMQSVIVSSSFASPAHKVGGVVEIQGIAVAESLFKMTNSTLYAFTVDTFSGMWVPLGTFSMVEEDILCDDPPYCTGNAQFNIPSDTQVGGPYLVNVMVSTVGNTMGDAFGIIGPIGNNGSPYQKLFIYSDDSVDLKLKNSSLKTPKNMAVPYFMYERGELSFDVEGIASDTCVLVSLYDAVNMTEYVTGCPPIHANEIEVLDWRYSMTENVTTNTLYPSGLYETSVYLDPNCSGMALDVNKLMLSDNNTMYVMIEKESNNGSVPFTVNSVNITNPGKYMPGADVTFTIETAFPFKKKTEIFYYFESCTQGMCKQISANMSFIYTKLVFALETQIPANVIATDITRGVSTRIVFMVYNCDGSVLLTNSQDLFIFLDYFIGSSFMFYVTDLNITEGAMYTAELIYMMDGKEESFDIPLSEPITNKTTAIQLDPIDLYGSLNSIIIPQETQGFIVISGINSTLWNQSVTIYQSIMTKQVFASPVQKVDDLLVISNVSVSTQAFKDLSFPTFYAFIVEVDGNSWTPKGTFEQTIANTSACNFTKMYCTLDITFSASNDSDIDMGGPYIVNVMLSEMNNTYGDAFTVIGRDALINKMPISDYQKLFIYSDESVNLMLKNTSIKTKMENAVPYYYYEKGPIKFDVDGLSDESCVFISLYDGNITEYISGCRSSMVKDFDVLDWRFKERSDSLDVVSGVPASIYQLLIYFDPDCSNTLNNDNKLELDDALYVKVETLVVNETEVTIPAINITNMKPYMPGELAEFDIVTSFPTNANISTDIIYYFEKCNNTCQPVGNNMSFTYDKEIYSLSVTVPPNLAVTDKQSNISTNIVFTVENCDGNGQFVFKEEVNIYYIEKYYIGSPYVLKYSFSPKVSTNYTVKLVVMDTIYEIPGGENIKPNTKSVALRPIKLYGKVSPLLIPDFEFGLIEVYSLNDTETKVYSENVTIVQSILVDKENMFDTPVTLTNRIFTIEGISVSQSLYESLDNATFYASIIDINEEETTWTPLFVFMEESQNNSTCVGVDGYCMFNKSFMIPEGSMTGGPYFVNLMITEEGQMYGNAFTVLGRETLISNNSVSDYNQLFIYNPKNIDLKLNNESMSLNAPYYYYEPGYLSFDIDYIKNPCVYITLSLEGNEYISGCASTPVDDFTLLDWRFTPRGNNLNNLNDYMPEGNYTVSIYLDPNCQQYIDDMNKIESSTPLIVSIQEFNNTVINAIDITNKGQYTAGYPTTFTIETSFPTKARIPTIIEYWFESCDSSGCSRLNNKTMNFTYSKVDYDLSVTIPGELKLTDVAANQSSQIMFEVENCIGYDVLSFTASIEIIAPAPSPDNNSNGLSAGAIVGIVCAGVLVCGLAAWWICMRKSQGDGYRQLDE